MSISNLRVGESTLTGQGRTHLTIRFLRFVLNNTCLLPDSNLLCDETIRNANGEGEGHSSSMHLRSFYKTQSLIEKQFLSLSSSPIQQILFILGSNIHNPSKIVLLNFQECDINSATEEDTHKSLADGCFPVFFRNLRQCSNYAAMFGGNALPTRLNIYFKSKKGLRFGDCVPKVDFRPPIRGVHVINVLSMEDTMELSDVIESGDDSLELANYAWHLMAPQDDEMWFACSKTIPVFNFFELNLPYSY